MIAKIDKFGRVLVPQQLRAELELQPGMDVVFFLDEGTRRVGVESPAGGPAQRSGGVGEVQETGRFVVRGIDRGATEGSRSGTETLGGVHSLTFVDLDVSRSNLR